MNNSEKYKILLAEDEPQNVRLLFEALNPGIYRVFVASNGKSAVEQALRYQPDAIIMDWGPSKSSEQRMKLKIFPSLWQPVK